MTLFRRSRQRADGPLLFLKYIAGALLLAYPLIVYFGVSEFNVDVVAILLAALAIIRLIVARQVAPDGRLTKTNNSMSIFLVTCCLLVLVLDSKGPLLFYPVIVNFLLFLLFMHTVIYPPSMIEKFARLQHPELPQNGVRYTRAVTIVWSVFFLLNGVVALGTALYNNMDIWTFYNGFISYVLIGFLIIGEVVIRPYIRKRI